MRIHPLAAALLLACAALPAAAQEVLRPGAAAVQTQAIAERQERYEVYAGENPDPVGDFYLRTRLATVDGTDAVVRKEQMLIHGDLVQVDSFSLDRRTLAPLRMRTSDEGQTRWLHFAADSVHVVREGHWGMDTVHFALPEPVFLASSADLLLAALPLAEGFTAELAVFGVNEGMGTMEIEVEADETLSIFGGARVRTWRVRVSGTETAGTYWMDRESHALVQFENEDGDVRIVRSGRGPRHSRPTR